MLLDGHSLAYRAFFALPVENFSTTTGQPTNAVYGFTSMLVNVIRDEKPTHLAVAFDVSRKTFRSEMFPAYKANRESSPEAFKNQVPLIEEVLTALGVKILKVDGFEADDIIATLKKQAEADQYEVLIVTGDRDSFQLVDEHTTVLYPRKGMSDLARMTPDAVVEKYGLTPTQYPDFAALRGDPSDNLPGIPGVGEKTATKWIVEYGSLANLIDNCDKVTGKVGESLRANVANVLLNRELTQLHSDVPMELHVDDCGMAGFDRIAVDQLFDTLQFRALRDRIGVLQVTDQEESEPVVAAGLPAAEVVAGVDAASFLSGLHQPVTVALAGSWGRGTGSLDRLCVLDNAGVIGVLEFDDANSKSAAIAWLSDAKIAKIGHDVKGPTLALLALGGTLSGVEIDTALAAYLASPGQRSYALEAVVNKFLGRELLASASGEQMLFDTEVDYSPLVDQVFAIKQLAELFSDRLESAEEKSLLADLEIPVTELLADLEFVGIAVDRELLDTLSREFAEDMRVSEETAHALVGRSFNLGSPKQLQEILFVEKNLPKTKKIKTGYTTDAEALQGLFAQTHDPLLAAILEWRERSKLRQTVEGLIPLTDASGRIHTTFHQTVAATGRLSSSDPNLQNIPIRTEAGRRIRGTFIVGEGFTSLMTADYSQIEMRIMAHASADAGLIAAFNAGEDLHTTVASQVFGVKPDDVDAEMRRKIKAMSYGLAYGLSAYGLGQQLDIGPAEAQRLMDTYFSRFGGVRDFLSAVVEEARLRGYTETLLGRRRYLPDLTSDNRQRREMAERMALNAPIQGTAADIMKVAMLNVARELKASTLKSRILLQVHDELVLEIHGTEADEVEALVREAMAGAADLRVPLDVSVGVGHSWESAAH
ncbi:unannotated protein [freshwater metagenome]|uniref:Unannotated protein n=1 Tax=freshwater metagenome TaxID=449393 RepID=A0A6J6ITY4_9ZZZZ|nr:DNA polymerase I [Actinomycetota bacterium]